MIRVSYENNVVTNFIKTQVATCPIFYVLRKAGFDMANLIASIITSYLKLWKTDGYATKHVNTIRKKDSITVFSDS